MSMPNEPLIPRERITRCLKYLQEWREHLTHVWTGQVAGVPDTRSIGNAVDDIISLELLVEKARRLAPSSVPPLREVITNSKARSLQDLWTAVGQSASSPLLAAVFQMDGIAQELLVPAKVLSSPWPDRISKALSLMCLGEMPFTFFGDFHQLCLARPLEEIFFHFGTLETQRRRHDWGAHYTPATIVDYLVCRTLGEQVGGEGPAMPSPPRILDPSCGCGAFLIPAAQSLLRSSAVASLSAWERLEIIAHAVFGIDIDRKAADWTRRQLLLAVWKSCVEDGRDIGVAAGRETSWLDRNILCTDFLRHADPLAICKEPECSELFDVIIGGPPFVRLQDLTRTQPDQVEEYKRLFVTARCGSFDLYMLFIEKALSLLRTGGRLGFGVSNSFLRSSSGQALRKLISDVATVDEIVEFPDTQVYPDAKVQIALLCLRKGSDGRPTRYIRLRGAAAAGHVLRQLQSTGGENLADAEIYSLNLAKIGEKPWLCGDAAGPFCLDGIKGKTIKLGLMPGSIGSGESTGADKVFLLERVRDASGGVVLVRESQYGETFHVETESLRSITRGRDIKAYMLSKPTTLCIFPYDERGEALSEQVLKKRFPATYSYLLSRKDSLVVAKRRRGNRWWLPQFRKPQTSLSGPRLIAGKVGFGANFAIDTHPLFLCHSTVVAIQTEPGGLSPYYLLGILNSAVFSRFSRHRMPAIGQERPVCRIGALREFPIVLPDGPMQSACLEIAALARELCGGPLGVRRRQEAQARIDMLARGLYGIG